MTVRVTPSQFQQAAGTQDWRVLFSGACTCFRTGTFATGVTLVGLIGGLADAANHHPDVDLRYSALTVRLWTHEIEGLSERDVSLARDISAAARELGVVADPSRVQDVQISIDALSPGVMPFWRAVLGYRQVGHDDLLDPNGRGPSFWFQHTDEDRPGRNRAHVDIAVPDDQAEARVAAAIAAGGRLVNDEHAPAWWTLADPEGNEVDVATLIGRD